MADLQCAGLNVGVEFRAAAPTRLKGCGRRQDRQALMIRAAQRFFSDTGLGGCNQGCCAVMTECREIGVQGLAGLANFFAHIGQRLVMGGLCGGQNFGRLLRLGVGDRAQVPTRVTHPIGAAFVFDLDVDHAQVGAVCARHNCGDARNRAGKFVNIGLWAWHIGNGEMLVRMAKNEGIDVGLTRDFYANLFATLKAGRVSQARMA